VEAGKMPAFLRFLLPHLPSIGLEASTYRIGNEEKNRLFNDTNRKGGTLAIGVKWDFFDGGRAERTPERKAAKHGDTK
jgi:outer membrane protein TolC